MGTPQSPDQLKSDSSHMLASSSSNDTLLKEQVDDDCAPTIIDGIPEISSNGAQARFPESLFGIDGDKSVGDDMCYVLWRMMSVVM